jgi:hypothetical protein
VPDEGCKRALELPDERRRLVENRIDTPGPARRVERQCGGRFGVCAGAGRRQCRARRGECIPVTTIAASVPTIASRTSVIFVIFPNP